MTFVCLKHDINSPFLRYFKHVLLLSAGRRTGKRRRLFPISKTQISVLRSILLILMEHEELKLICWRGTLSDVTRDNPQQQLSARQFAARKVVPCNMARITAFSDFLFRQNVASFWTTIKILKQRNNFSRNRRCDHINGTRASTVHCMPEVLSNRKSALDPAEIMEFYSTFSAWRPAGYYIPL